MEMAPMETALEYVSDYMMVETAVAVVPEELLISVQAALQTSMYQLELFSQMKDGQVMVVLRTEQEVMVVQELMEQWAVPTLEHGVDGPQANQMVQLKMT